MEEIKDKGTSEGSKMNSRYMARRMAIITRELKYSAEWYIEHSEGSQAYTKLWEEVQFNLANAESTLRTLAISQE